MSYLEQLSNTFGVSGAEDDVRKIVLEAAKPHADSWRIDTMGNLFFNRQPRGDDLPHKPPRVMLTAHMDEVGFLISEIKENGHLKFKPVGGFDRRVLLGKTLHVGAERIPGVIGIKPIHLLRGKAYRKVDKIDAMYIDVGASSKGEAKVKVGEYATFATEFSILGGEAPPPNGELPHQGRVKGKAFDDRVGCAVLLELLGDNYPVELAAVFTVQEEIGLRGAKVAGYATDPDIALILECTAADDLPRDDDEDELGIPRLGDGPAITVMDGSFIANRQLVDLLIETAEAHDIPYQFKRPGVGGTDGGAIHLARRGVPTVAVSVPARYIHSPAAILDLADFWHTVALVRAALPRLSNFKPTF